MNTRERITKIITEHLGVEESKCVDDADFVDDLGCDSLDLIELVMAMEEEFGIEITDDEGDKVQSYGDAVRLVEGKINGD